jgi:tRNA U34 2-thiouridine synthase MnmA/TrmU
MESPYIIHQSVIRKIAIEEKLLNAERKSSKGICFIGKKHSFSDWIAEYMDCPNGTFLDVGGKFLGVSRYAGLYTIGQGAKISGVPVPLFVYEKDVVANRVYVCSGTDSRLWQGSLVAQDLNWIVNIPNLEVNLYLLLTG